MIDNKEQVFSIEGVALKDFIKEPSPWVYEDCVSVPLSTWDTIMDIMEKNHPNEYSIIISYLNFNENDDHFSTKGAIKKLRHVARNIEYKKYIVTINKRIESKLDRNFELEEYKRIINNISSILELSIEQNTPIDTWVD